MKTNCECKSEVRAGSFQGVNFRICLKCRYLQWEPHEGLTFIRPEFVYKFQLRPDVEQFQLVELMTWLEGALQAFQKLNLAIDYEWLGLEDIGDFDSDWASDLIEDFVEFGEVALKIVSNISIWEMELPEEEREGFVDPLVVSKLASYTTDQLLVETLREMWFEMGDYMQKAQAHGLMEFLSAHEIRGPQLVISLQEFDLVNPLPVSWDQATVGPEIER